MTKEQARDRAYRDWMNTGHSDVTNYDVLLATAYVNIILDMQKGMSLSHATRLSVEEALQKHDAKARVLNN
jgi:hypothetical protein